MSLRTRRSFRVFFLSTSSVVLLMVGLSSCSRSAVRENREAASVESVAAEPPEPITFAPSPDATDLPSWEQLAKDFGLENAEAAEAFAKDFVNLLSYGKRSQYYERICGPKPELCVSVDKYFEDMEAQSRARLQARREKRRNDKIFRLKPAQAAHAQSTDLKRLLGGLTVKEESELHSLAAKALEVQTCPRNLSATLSLRASKFFPKPENVQLAKQLFDHAEPCLSNADTSWEMFYLRHGLLAVQQNDFERAERYLLQSMEGPTKLEQYRTLYWLGWIQNQRGAREPDNRYWQVLNRDFPLSYYSVKALKTWGRDPMAGVPEQPLTFARESQLRPEVNQRIRWVEVLLRAGARTPAKRWMEWMNADIKDIEVPVIHYLSGIALKESYYRQTITLLIRYYRWHPERVDRAGIRSLYPRPFFENVHEEARDRIHTHLVMSLIRQESAFDPLAVSGARAKGLMQIIPQTARRLLKHGDRKLFDEKANMSMGVKYLAKLGERFSGEVELALAAYNAGPNRVDEWLGRFPDRHDPLLWNDLIPFMETRDYVVSILRNNYWYERLYPLKKSNDGVLASKLVEDLVREVN